MGMQLEGLALVDEVVMALGLHNIYSFKIEFSLYVCGW